MTPWPTWSESVRHISLYDHLRRQTEGTRSGPRRNAAIATDITVVIQCVPILCLDGSHTIYGDEIGRRTSADYKKTIKNKT